VRDHGHVISRLLRLNVALSPRPNQTQPRASTWSGRQSSDDGIHPRWRTLDVPHVGLAGTNGTYARQRRLRNERRIEAPRSGSSSPRTPTQFRLHHQDAFMTRSGADPRTTIPSLMVNRCGRHGQWILWLALERIHRSILVVPRGGRHHARPSPDLHPGQGHSSSPAGGDYSYTSLDPMDTPLLDSPAIAMMRRIISGERGLRRFGRTYQILELNWRSFMMVCLFCLVLLLPLLGRGQDFSRRTTMFQPGSGSPNGPLAGSKHLWPVSRGHQYR